ncbi:hypothetical protein [Bacillus licheniformis]
MRKLIGKNDWGTMNLFKKIMLPLVVCTGAFNICIGLWEPVLTVLWLVWFFAFLVVYTKKGSQEQLKLKSKKPKWLVVSGLVLLWVIGAAFLFDNIRYGVAVSQIQFENEGYNKIQSMFVSGDFSGLVAVEVRDDNITLHKFDGWRYSSAEGITEDVRENSGRIGVNK